MLLEKELGLTENSYYEATTIRPPAAERLLGSVAADVCVVGGGYSGLSAALELASQGYSVVVLEARRIGWGASGRNGGQVIVGFAAENAIEKQLSPADARRAWDVSVEGLDLLRSRIARHAIDCDYQTGYLTVAVNSRKARALEAWIEHLETAYGYSLQWVGPGQIDQWIASRRFYAGACDQHSGHLHPLKFCLGLARAVRTAGAQIYENSPVTGLRQEPSTLVSTRQGQVACRFVVLAGNVYLDEYSGLVAPRLQGRIIPVGTYIIATGAMDAERAGTLIKDRAAVSDTNFVLDYFRLTADNRLLFGAGDSYSARTPRRLRETMQRKMLMVFPQLSDLDVEYAWGGFVDLTMNKAPDFGRLDANIYYLQGFSGHGLALSGMAGKLVAEAIAGQAERFDVFSKIRHRRFPGGTLVRTPALMLGILYFRIRDVLG